MTTEPTANRLTLADVQERAEELISIDAERDVMFDDMQAMYNMVWQPENLPDWMQVTISPACHNAIRGVRNLLLSTEPTISVPVDRDQADQQAKKRAGTQEMALRLMLDAASKQRQQSVAYDAVHNATLFGLIALKLGVTSEIARAAKGVRRTHYEQIAAQCPFIVDTPIPKSIHYLSSSVGLECVVEARQRPVSELRALWGDKAAEGRDLTETVIYYEYWDPWQTFVWLEDDAEALYDKRHGWGYVPYVIQSLGEPLLYPVWAGRLWQMQNVGLTALTSSASNLAFPPMVTEVGPGDSDQLNFERLQAIDWTQPGQNITVHTGTKVSSPLEKMLGVSAAIMEMVNRTESLIEMSTLNRVVFGQAPQDVTAFSALNTLLQGARLPLTHVQVGVGWALSRLCELMLRSVQRGGEAVNLYGHGKLAELDPSIIEPDHIEVEVKLKPDYPQDRLQLANVVTLLGKSGYISKEKALELLGNMQPNEEQKRIVGDVIEQALMQGEVQRVLQIAQQSQQFPTPEAPQQPVMPEQVLPPEMPTEQNLPPGVQPQMLGQPPEAQMMNAAMGGGPPPEEAF